MPDRHSNPCRPSATQRATSGSQSSPAATTSDDPSRSTPRVRTSTTVPRTPSSASTTFAAMDQLRALGEDIWFNLGDRDLAIGLHRARRLADGGRLTEAVDDLRRAFGVPARVLVPSDDPVRTWVRTGGGWRPFQDFM